MSPPAHTAASGAKPAPTASTDPTAKTTPPTTSAAVAPTSGTDQPTGMASLGPVVPVAPAAPVAPTAFSAQVTTRAWSRRARVVASLLIAVHIAAVFIAPFTFASTPAPGVSDGSPAALAAMRWFHPYIEAMFLQHGYAFFAPDPGPSHLFRVKLEFADGRPAEEWRFPDLQRHRPRLLYHRHFMLSERLWVGHVPSVAPPGLSENIEELMQWRRSRESYETYYHTLRDSYLQHLIHRRGAAKGVLARVEHRLAGVDEIRERRRRLNAPESYAIHPDDARLFGEAAP